MPLAPPIHPIVRLETDPLSEKTTKDINWREGSGRT
jgi:hypothetical protein